MRQKISKFFLIGAAVIFIKIALFDGLLMQFIILGRIGFTDIVLNTYFVGLLAALCSAMLVTWARSFIDEYRAYSIKQYTPPATIAKTETKPATVTEPEAALEELDLISL